MTTYAKWLAKRNELDKAHKTASSFASQRFQDTLTHDQQLMLQVTLPSGTRMTIGFHDLPKGGRLVVTAAGGGHDGFLTLGMLTSHDLEAFLKIRRAIEAWVAGEIEELPRPTREFGPWPGFEEKEKKR